MADTDESLTVIEECRISAPCDTVGERSLSLTFFDFIWLLHPFPVHHMFAYEFSHSKTHFIEKVIPTLKHSLSLTLQHFFPFAGNLIVSKDQKPIIRHVEGDSIALTFVECDLDFNHLKGNHPRDCNKFYGLVPTLERGVKCAPDESMKFPLFSVQVTLFPKTNGITIGMTFHHILCDAITQSEFLTAWAIIANSGTDKLFLARGVLPVYSRVIKYPSTLDERFINFPITLDQYHHDHQINIDKVRATIVLTRPKINRLKEWVSTKLPTLEYVSSFSVACGYIWSCIAKSRTQYLGETSKVMDDDELEKFGFVVDWRGRLDPPISQSYFGNVLWPCSAIVKTSSLYSSSSLGTNGSGFLTAVELLGNAISEKVNMKGGVIKDIETWDGKLSKALPTIGVAGTPKLKVYNLNFGWGKPIKYELISIDYNGSISINAGKESPEDIEIGLSLPTKQMETFIAIFENELENIFYEQHV